tara:strand:- start:3097 stop:3546 length:450 start_codon:yes stop_codon:yes gene_type:complete
VVFYVTGEKMNYKKWMLVVIFLVLSPTVYGGEKPLDEDPVVYIISPVDGSTNVSPVRVVFGLSGMGVAPAGVQIANTGHHHLLIDVDSLPESNLPIPSDKKHRHFGAGQTEASVDLSPGSHTLQLILGDHYHIPHTKPVVSKKITIKVK